VLARLEVHSLLRLEQMAERRPRMSGAAGHFIATEVSRGRAAVLSRQLALVRGPVVQPSRGLQRLAQFQTLTSR
jgi:hypothetical protein